MADAVYTELDARSRTEYVQPMVLAVAALGAGRLSDVFRNLSEAVEIRDPFFALLAQYWPRTQPIPRPSAGATGLTRTLYPHKL